MDHPAILNPIYTESDPAKGWPRLSTAFLGSLLVGAAPRDACMSEARLPTI